MKWYKKMNNIEENKIYITQPTQYFISIKYSFFIEMKRAIGIASDLN